MSSSSAFLFAAILLSPAALPLRAVPLVITAPDAGYLASTTRLPISGADLSTVSVLSDDQRSATFSRSLTVGTVDITWSFWGAPPATETSTPRVVFTNSTAPLTITLSAPVQAFGIEIEPDDLDSHLFTVAFRNGNTVTGTVSASIAGYAGARLFAVSGRTTGDSFTSVIITPDANSGGFALANVRYSAVPEPATFVLFGAGLIVIGLTAFRRRS